MWHRNARSHQEEGVQGAAVFSHRLPVFYAISPMPSGNWMVDAMPPEPGSFAQRLLLPEAWPGLRDADFAAASGVKDALFVHTRRFVDAAKSCRATDGAPSFNLDGAASLHVF
jgi:uncharacterized UPF0160 family protein